MVGSSSVIQVHRRVHNGCLFRHLTSQSWIFFSVKEACGYA
jgi:hypothetical protein